MYTLPLDTLAGNSGIVRFIHAVLPNRKSDHHENLPLHRKRPPWLYTRKCKPLPSSRSPLTDIEWRPHIKYLVPFVTLAKLAKFHLNLNEEFMIGRDSAEKASRYTASRRCPKLQSSSWASISARRCATSMCHQRAHHPSFYSIRCRTAPLAMSILCS